jgi:hypothetical protein
MRATCELRNPSFCENVLKSVTFKDGKRIYRICILFQDLMESISHDRNSYQKACEKACGESKKEKGIKKQKMDI